MIYPALLTSPFSTVLSAVISVLRSALRSPRYIQKVRMDFLFSMRTDAVLTRVRAGIMMEKKKVWLMDTNLNVHMAPKDSTVQVRINSEIKKVVSVQYGADRAKQVTKTITGAIKGFALYEKKGPVVSDLFDVITDYRYLFVSKNYVFYHIEDESIRIVNLPTRKCEVQAASRICP